MFLSNKYLLNYLCQVRSLRGDPLIITIVTSKWITQNREMSLKSSDYRTKKKKLILNYILFAATYL